MRIADVVFRQGHLSERALTDALVSGERPDHLAGCDRCSRRALELGRWLDDIRLVAADAADEAFPPERLAMQQAQIMRRLEQLDEPSRIIAFPAQAVGAPRSGSGRRVAPAWLGVAAAAGLVLGVIGSQAAARIGAPAAPEQTQQTAPEVVPAQPANASLFDYDLDRQIPDALLVYDELTPSLLQAQYAVQ